MREMLGLGLLPPSQVVLLRLLLMGVRVCSGVLESKDIPDQMFFFCVFMF